MTSAEADGAAADEGRGHHLSGLELRPGLCPLASSWRAGSARGMSGTVRSRSADADAVIVPGGFAHGDYLRPGRDRPLQPDHGRRDRTSRAAGGLDRRDLQRLPGPLRGGTAAGGAASQPSRSASSHTTAACAWSAPTPRTPPSYRVGQVIGMPLSHADGNYYADAETLAACSRRKRRVVFRYCDAARCRDVRKPTRTAR